MKTRLATGVLALWLSASSAIGADRSHPDLRVVTSFYPMYVATLNVVAGVPGVSLRNMADRAAGCLHDYQMTTDDLVTLSSSDVFIINGGGMEAFLDKAVRQVPRLKVVDASRGIELLCDGDRTNAHVWVSVSRHMRQVANIAEGLASVDPAHAEPYRRNAAAYTNRLDALRLRMEAGLKGVRTRDIVTFHEAFAYFAAEFGLRVIAVIEHEPGAEPSGRELADTIRTVRQAGTRALFAEPQYSAGTAAAIARETGATVYMLDPAVSGPLTTNAYIDIMQDNLRELRRALR